MSKIIGIIPARGGSKRLPKKNILPLLNIPLINYTIQAAKKSSLINHVIVSTDDKEISDIANNSGADVYLRPKNLASDYSKSVDVCTHTLNEFQAKEGFEPDVFVLLQPTSPLRSENHIDEALNLLDKKNAYSVISVCPVEYSLDSFININQEGTITPIFSESLLKQDPKSQNIYRLNGAIYAIRTNYFKKEKTFYSEQTYPYVMSPNNSVDIDTAFDFQLASFLMSKKD